jgi:two-component system NtrC family response regulator
MSTTLDAVPAAVRDMDAFHELLPAIASALDVRDVFRRLSEVAARIVPHDEANLALLSDDGSRFRMFASTADGPPETLCRDDRCIFKDLSQARLFTPGAGFSTRLISGVSAPVRIGDQAIGVLALLSQQPHAYAHDDLTHVQRLADYVAVALSHQRLAEAARLAAVDRERSDSLESSVELLRAIAGVLDIRTVFPRISEIVAKVLPHDRMTMAFYEGDDFVLQAASNDEFPDFKRAKLSRVKDRTEFRLIDDLTHETLPVLEPADVQARLVDAGYRSWLSVHGLVRDQEIGIAFWSKRIAAFRASDFPVAQRVVDHVALAVSHEQLADAARQVAEARGRAERLEARVKVLAEELDAKTGYGRVVGQSDEWKDTLRKATQVAATDTTVLLTGESGTGKEVVARFIHRASTRNSGPFVALNCAALPEQLLESELFGYERGAFTGAQHSKPGQIELAAGGVLFLDEVSEMSASAQAKFLRVLQEREFQRLGGTRPQKTNVRVIAATNRDLKKAMERGDFREDLYYRLQVFDIALTPLRDRRADILPLSESFLADIGRSFGRPPAGLTHDAKDALLQHTWPGNVRELRNTLERAAILCEGGLITAQHLSLHAAQLPAGSVTTDLRVVERETIESVMRETGGNKMKAAKRLGLSRTQLYVRLRKYGLDNPRDARP